VVVKNGKIARILIADDDPQVTTALLSVIGQVFPCNVETCGDGDTVLNKLAEQPYDVLVTDMLMPGRHGIELIREAKRVAPDCDILVMTAYPNEFPFLEAVRAGASDFMTKPYPAEEMGARLLRMFRERAARRNPDATDLSSNMQGASDRKYGLLFERNMNGMIVLEPSTHVIVDANAAVCELWGHTREELLGTPITQWFLKSDVERFQYGMKAIAGNKRGALADIQIRQSSGKQVWVDVSVSYIDTVEEAWILLVFTDVTEKRLTTDRLAQMATTDGLTGLLNQRTFYAWLEGEIESAVSNRTALSLVFVDVDNFKKCNDTFGHQTGDSLLRSIGETIRRSVRSQDRAFRYGGDEFAVIVHGNAEAALRAAQRIREGFDSLERYGTSLSLGVAEHRNGMDAKSLVKAADEALYQAKAAGKNTVCRTPTC